MQHSKVAADGDGGIPDSVVETIKGLGLDVDSVDYDDLPDIDDKYMDVLQGGEEHVSHEGLIDAAHKCGLSLVWSEPLMIPEPDESGGYAQPVVFRAVVVTDHGVFMGHGDSKSDDTMVDACIRMAETRAVSRALRSAVNVGSATAPEMPDSDDGVVVSDG